MVHKALDIADPGDVLVVDAGGDLTNAIIGEIMAAHAKQRGLAGVVINGAIRDADSIRAGAFPVFAAGVTHRGPYKDGPGEINVPVAIDGMVVEPGDLILGDGDGLLCIPYEATAAVHALASEKHKTEEREIRASANGTLDRRWVDARAATARMRRTRLTPGRRSRSFPARRGRSRAGKDCFQTRCRIGRTYARAARGRMLRQLCARTVLLACAGLAHAQAYPNKPIRMIVPWPPAAVWTLPRESSRSRWPSGSVSRSSSRTSPVSQATSAPRSSPRKHRTAIRS